MRHMSQSFSNSTKDYNVVLSEKIILGEKDCSQELKNVSS